MCNSNVSTRGFEALSVLWLTFFSILLLRYVPEKINFTPKKKKCIQPLIQYDLSTSLLAENEHRRNAGGHLIAFHSAIVYTLYVAKVNTRILRTRRNLVFESRFNRHYSALRKSITSWFYRGSKRFLFYTPPHSKLHNLASFKLE